MNLNASIAPIFICYFLWSVIFEELNSLFNLEHVQVVFWKWINPKMLGLVTQASVYHWSIEGKPHLRNESFQV